jgi:hypothetical protein
VLGHKLKEKERGVLNTRNALVQGCNLFDPSGFVTIGSTSMRSHSSLITKSWGILVLKVLLQFNHLHNTLFPFINTFIDLNYKFYYCFAPYIQSSPYFALLYTINYLNDHLRTFYGGAVVVLAALPVASSFSVYYTALFNFSTTVSLI